MDRLAYYKTRPPQSIPHRPGPVQCVRNCPTCIVRHDFDEDIEAEELISIMSYENLLHRKARFWSSYTSIQYHPGQVRILKRYLDNHKNISTLFVVGTTVLEDLEFLIMALDHERMPGVEQLDDKLSWVGMCELKQLALVPIKMTSCYSKSKEHKADTLLGVMGLRDLLVPIVRRALEVPSFNLNIVPVVISKDHDKTGLGFFRLGSVCINIFEPYSLQQYLSNIRSDYHTGHLVTHLYYDMARNAPKLPTHLVAYIIHNVEGPMTKDLIAEYVEWFRSVSMELNLQIAFTGSSMSAVEFALYLLSGYYETHGENIYYTGDPAIVEYAHSLMPNVAYYGIISRAILKVYNADANNAFRYKFNSEDRIRVMKEDLLKVSVHLAEEIDESLPCRRPCTTVETSILSVFESMEKLGKYFKVEEPAISKPKTGCPWAGDYDDDDDYFESKRDDPRFKAWVVLTRKQNRLDKLNMFMNSLTGYSRTMNVSFN